MSIAHQRKVLEKSLSFYRNFLKSVNEEIFIKKPAATVWSYSEVYSHLLSTNQLSAVAIEKCLNKTAEIKLRKANWKVLLILFLGRFPPVKLKAPPKIANMVKTISKEEASNQLIKISKKMEDIYPQFKNFNPSYKIKHPRLGYLDARQWLWFMVIHTRHHQKQIKRIEKMLQA